MRIWQYSALNIEAVGGVETHIAQTSRELRSLGHEVHVGLDEPSFWNSALINDRIFQTHGDTWPRRDLLIDRISRRSHFPWVQVCHGTTVGRMLACREFLSLSGWKGSLRDFIPTQFADAAVAVGPEALKEARRYFRMRIPAKVITNGADTEIFKPLSALAPEPRVIFVGRGADRVKNTGALLEACRKIRAQYPGFELHAAPGFRSTESFLRNLGPLTAERLAQSMARCRALVLCSFYEGDPIVLHEAKALGLPIIASRIPQIERALENYELAWFIDPRDPESLRVEIERVLFKKPELKPMPQPRDWSQVARELEGFYQNLLSR